MKQQKLSLSIYFLKKGARRIYAYTEDYNFSSQHLCEKLGMRREGICGNCNISAIDNKKCDIF